jgi:flagellar basal-body rod protein FlgF
MVRGLYTAATGMTVQRNRMDILTNNIVNAETTGFKADTLITSTFDEVMLERINDPGIDIYGDNDVGGYSYGTHVDELVTNLTGGNLEETGKSTDLAIVGEGFFAVETAAGERYTRSGNFSVSNDGYLVTQDGNYVLGENGRIYVGSGDFTVSPEGVVSGEAAETDVLRIVAFTDPGALRKEGNNLFTTYGDAVAIPANGVAIRQGAQESSNVVISDEMVDMISVYRKYEANQKVVNMTDATIGLAVNLGKLGG